MYTDHTLTPREAVRLCALGILAGGARPYDEVVFAVRHFVSRISGPSLELMGESIDLLKYEGLVVHEGGGSAPLAITPQGRDVLMELLRANVRVGSGAMNDLILALKIRFLHLLEPDERRQQTETMIEACESELARLHDDESGHLGDWLAIEIARLNARIALLEKLLPDLDSAPVRRHTAS